MSEGDRRLLVALAERAATAIVDSPELAHRRLTNLD